MKWTRCAGFTIIANNIEPWSWQVLRQVIGTGGRLDFPLADRSAPYLIWRLLGLYYLVSCLLEWTNVTRCGRPNTYKLPASCLPGQ
jgi:hypothetical protein